MKRCIAVLIAAVMATCLAAPAAHAAEKKLPTLKIKDPTVTAYEEVCVNAGDAASRGVTEVLKLEGRLFLWLDAPIAAEWSEEMKNANLEAKDFQLLDDKGNACENIGRFDEDNRFSGYASGLWMHRPHNWQKPEELKPQHYRAVFLVPAGSKSFEFKVAEAASTKIEMPKKTEPVALPKMWEPLMPATEAKLEILEAKLVDTAQGKFRIGKKESPTRIYNPDGKLLCVKVRLTPTRSNSDMNEDHFYWPTSNLGLMYGDGCFVRAAGEKFMKGFTSNVSHNTNRDEKGWRSSEDEFYFAVPADIGAFKLTYHMTPVAEGKPGGPFKVLEVK